MDKIEMIMKEQNERVIKMMEIRNSGKVCCEMCDCWTGYNCSKDIPTDSDSMKMFDDCPGFEDD